MAKSSSFQPDFQKGGNSVFNDVTIRGTLKIGAAKKLVLVNENGKDVALKCNSDGAIVSNFAGDLSGNVTGNLTGNLTGNVTGNVTGNLTGNLTGNVTVAVGSSVYINGGECVVNSSAAYGQLHVQQKTDLRPPFSIFFHDNSIYKNLGSVGPNDRDGNNASSGGQYLHVRLRTVWNNASMTMFRITGYYSYSDYTESYVGMYRYNSASYRTNPYGQVVHNQKRATIHSIYNEAADPGYLVIVCDWGTNYMGLMFEHIGAGSAYASYMQPDIEIIDSLRSNATTALVF